MIETRNIRLVFVTVVCLAAIRGAIDGRSDVRAAETDAPTSC